MKQTLILITGGTGFAGSHLVEALLGHQLQNIHVTAFGSTNSLVSNLLPAENIHAVDLTSQEQTSALIKELQPSHIYHLAAYASVGDSFENAQKILEHNLRLQMILLEAVRLHSAKSRVLVIGSAMEYDVMNPSLSKTEKISETHPLGPVSPYAVSKVIQDLLGLSYAYSYNLDIVRARPFNHIGERQTTDFAVPSFAKQIVAIERGEQDEIKVGNLAAVRDFTDVKDVAEAYILLAENGESKQVYNIGQGVGHTMQEILDMLCQYSEKKIKVVQDPSKVRPLDVPSVIADNTKIRQMGWEPKIPLAETLKRILEEWRSK